MTTIKLQSPATVANMVCGFDILGFCVNMPFDIMEVKLLNEKKVVINNPGSSLLPTEPHLNTAGASLLDMLEELPDDTGFEVTIEKRIKPGSGLGSSAASAAGAVVAANHLLNNRFSKNDLVRFAMAGEKAASGVKHADNVAPVIYGGITLIRSIFPLDIISIPTPPLFVTIVHPQIEVRTVDARQILRKEVLLKDAIKQWGNIAGLVTGLIQSDYALIGRSLEDHIVEPLRSILIPEFKKIKEKCLDAGALGGGISGSGPSIFMLSKDETTAREIEKIMTGTYASLSLDHRTYVTSINQNGCTILKQS